MGTYLSVVSCGGRGGKGHGVIFGRSRIVKLFLLMWKEGSSTVGPTQPRVIIWGEGEGRKDGDSRSTFR